jgi:hypothetical protein
VGSNPTSGTNVDRFMAGRMRIATRSLASLALIAAFAAPALAGCPDGMREFRGAISEITAQKLFVESRLDDNIGFERAAETRVGGSKSSWDALAPGDLVAICWRFEDRPRKAVTISVVR